MNQWIGSRLVLLFFLYRFQLLQRVPKINLFAFAVFSTMLLSVFFLWLWARYCIAEYTLAPCLKDYIFSLLLLPLIDNVVVHISSLMSCLDAFRSPALLHVAYRSLSSFPWHQKLDYLCAKQLYLSVVYLLPNVNSVPCPLSDSLGTKEYIDILRFREPI